MPGASCMPCCALEGRGLEQTAATEPSPWVGKPGPHPFPNQAQAARQRQARLAQKARELAHSPRSFGKMSAIPTCWSKGR
jgi:hypothetical protein